MGSYIVVKLFVGEKEVLRGEEKKMKRNKLGRSNQRNQFE